MSPGGAGKGAGPGRMGKRPPSDQAARDAAKQQLKRSLFLEAGAGTGKTTVLLDRVTEILKTEISLDRIAVITFTEKAAGELKLKLRRLVEEMIRESGPETPWGGVLRRSLEALDRAAVSTIHSFAASLLRERPVEAGVDPRFTVADGLASAMLMEETWERWIEQEMSAGARPLAHALRLGVTLPQLRVLAFDLARHRDVDLGGAPLGEPRLVQARDRIVERAPELEKLSSACEIETDLGLQKIREVMARLPALRAATGSRLLALMQSLPLSPTSGTQSNWRPPSTLATVKSLIADLVQARDDATRHARTAFAHELALWLRAGFLHAYRQAKEERRLLDFTDLLILCRDMLRDKPAARCAFQDRFACLLVDEFQDTDPLQSEILFLLAAEDPQQTDWRQARVRPGKLFVVGDPKQSIYRFRRADVELYEEVKSMMAPGRSWEPLRLSQNFRTVPSIISWVNELFEGLIQPAADGAYQPRYSPIEAHREEPEPRGRSREHASRVVLLMPPPGAGLSDAAAGRVREQEARHVVALIRAAVAESWPVVEPKSGDARGLRHRDIALLFRTSTALEIYEEALRESGIPYRIAGGKRYYMRSEMRSLQAVLTAVERPHDPLAVVSALRCPFFGYSDEDLVTYAASGAGWAYTREGTGRGTSFERAFELLGRLHAARNARPFSATLEDLYGATGALALFCLKPDGEQRAANLLKAIELARAHEAASGATFGSFVRWLSGMAVEEREEAEAPLSEETETSAPDEDSDAVRIMTVHKAKGLEFPMVILCDAAGGGSKESPTCIVERGGGRVAHLEYRFGAGPMRFESAGYALAMEREKRRLEAESRRLLYVAATRARDHLVIPAFGGKRAEGMYATLRERGFLPAGVPPEPVHRGARLLDGASLDTSRRETKPLRILAEDAVPPEPAYAVEKEGWRRARTVALSAPTMGRVFRSASALEERPGAARFGPGATAGSGPEEALALGVAVHAALERIDLATGRDIGLLCEEEAAEVGRPDLAAEVRELVQVALEGRVVKEALASPRHFREMPFAAAGDTFLTEGRADLVFESGGGLTVVDFKTDRVVTEAEISARVEVYRPQALAYAAALTQATGLAVNKVVFFFLRPGVERALKSDERFLSQGRALLESGSVPATS